MKFYKEEKALQYSEVFIVPQYSTIESRSRVSTSQDLDSETSIDVPVISANMDSVTESDMAIYMWKGGGIGALHRFMSVDDNVKMFEKVTNAGAKCFVSIGTNSDAISRAKSLFLSGARYFIIDIAHGHSIMMSNTIKSLRDVFGDNIYIMAGNVATSRAVGDLASWGADAVKIGIGPGNVCLTKNVTGVTYPQFSAVAQSASCIYSTHSGKPMTLVADGGIQEIGDIAKAIGAGAHMVMCGRMFAGCTEAPGRRENGQKVYRGMASKDAMLSIRSEVGMPTPEGKSIMISDSNQTVVDILRNIKGGLQSAMSYSNARNIHEFQKNVMFGIRT